MKQPENRPEVQCPGCRKKQKGRLETGPNGITRWFCENVHHDGTHACGVVKGGVQVTVFDEYLEYFPDDFAQEARNNEQFTYDLSDIPGPYSDQF